MFCGESLSPRLYDILLTLRCMAQIPLLFYTIIQKFVVGKIFFVFWILNQGCI